MVDPAPATLMVSGIQRIFSREYPIIFKNSGDLAPTRYSPTGVLLRDLNLLAFQRRSSLTKSKNRVTNTIIFPVPNRPVLAGTQKASLPEQPSISVNIMTDNTYGAKLQRDGKTYAIQTRIPAGVVSPDDLETLARVAKKYAIPLVKITSGQRFLLVGVLEKDIVNVRKDLGPLGTASITPGVRYVQSCPGISFCKNGTQDSISIAKEISDEYAGKEFPAKIKIGISGCPRCCGESRVRDIGIMGSAKGWTVSFGGHSGFKSRMGEQVATGLSSEEAKDCVRKLLTFYKTHAEPKERTSRFLERTGNEWIKKIID